MSKTWFIQIDGRTIGPLAESELVDLAQRGAVAYDTPVSDDQISWKPAETISEVSLSTPTRTSPRSSPSSERTAAFGIIGAGVAVAVVGFALLCVLGVLMSSSATQEATPEAHFVANAVSSPVVIPPSNTPRLTLEYWGRVGTMVRSLEFKGSTKQIVERLSKSANSIEQLPVVDVDPDAVQCALAVSSTLRTLAQRAERNNDPSILIETVVRGIGGDPFGKGLELMQEGREAQQMLNKLQSDIATTRAVLSQRFGLEFPTW